jgi:hypothetical protein
MTNAADLARSLAYHRAQDAIAQQAAVDTAYARGRLDGALHAHARAVALCAAHARQDLAAVHRNLALLAAARA